VLKSGGIADDQQRIVAVLGPTNTGKTRYAIERMLGHRTGVIGLPLRLLAREVYERIVALRGQAVVALVTGEERLVPNRARYWVCTAEAMPEGLAADFIGIDEIQMCSDPERGHVFTDRLLRFRGLRETMFLGSDTMRGAIAALVPSVRFERKQRLSTLTYTGPRKISRMLPRSAIVGFSVDQVYAVAELLRRQKGGAAVVMGALSPRTRNAQVAMYQNGDVDHLVATDAIGVGLNLDINHIAFSSLSKFDGRRLRPLRPDELAQIAGRAGRYVNDGTFGVTGGATALDDHVAEAIVNSRFAPVRKLQWRNAELDFGTVDRLIASLETGSDDMLLTRTREADDLLALKGLAELPYLRREVTGAHTVKLLWEVCRIPDFRGISHAEHTGLLERIFCFLREHGRVPDDWLAGQVRRIDRTDGDIDTLSRRLAYIRTWTYVAQRKGWVDDESHWRGLTHAVEDRLSDALHGALTRRFVDRRTSVLLRRLKQKEAMLAEVNDRGEVSVEGQFVGRLDGFRFTQDASAPPEQVRTLRTAALQALKPEFSLRADRFYNSPDTEMDFTDQGGLMWGEHAVGKLVAGHQPMAPQVAAFVDEEAGPEVVDKVERRLRHFVSRRVDTLFEPLLKLRKDETLTGLARGFAFRLIESFGIIRRDDVADEVRDLDQDARGQLRRHGVRFGQFTVFIPVLLKPAPTRLRLVLWGLSRGYGEFPESPTPGLVTIPVTGFAQGDAQLTMAGYRVAGQRAVRVDMLERLADLLRIEDSRAGFEASPAMLSITGMTLEQFADLMQGLGYVAARATRDRAVNAVGGAASEDPLDDRSDSVGMKGLEERSAASTGPAHAEDDSMAVSRNGNGGHIDGSTADPAPVASAEEEAADGGVADRAAASEADPPVAREPEEPTLETYFTFTWRRKTRGRRAGSGPPTVRVRDAEEKRPRRKGKPKGATDPPKPPGKGTAVDPDSPFAVLLKLKDENRSERITPKDPN